MVFGKKKEEEKELTMQEAIVELGKSMKAINSRLDKIEQQPKPEPQATPNDTQATPEIKTPVAKKDKPDFIIYDQPIKTKRIIIDNKDPENPIVYDTESAIAKILNDIAYLRKALA